MAEQPHLPGVSRATAVDLAQRLADLYVDAERILVTELARRLAAGIDRPRWADEKLAAIATLRAWVRRLLLRLELDSRREVTYAITAAYMRGGQEALLALAEVSDSLPEWVAAAGVTPGPRLEALLIARGAALAATLTQLQDAFPGLGNVQGIIGELALRVASTHLPILRWVDDAYRTAVANGAAAVGLGIQTRRQATQATLDRLVAQGVTGFTDSAGRRWNLASYVEMAVRTGVAHAAVQGHLDRLQAASRDLVIVSDSPQECELCRPWEGRILSITSDGHRRIERPHATRGTPVVVNVAGSVAQALAAGLWHPNCRHTVSLFLPGVTRIPTHTEDPEGDRARQRLRYLERGVRAWRLREAAALDDATRKRASAYAKAWQGRIRQHVADHRHLGITRKPERERINLGHTIGRQT